MAAMTELMPTSLVVVLAILVTITATARLTRLVVHDDFPPTMWWRDLWDKWTRNSDWNKVMHCGFCFSFWAAVFVVGTGLLLSFSVVWFLIFGTLGASYLAAIIMTSDWG